MNNPQTDLSAKPLRLWPGVVLALLQIISWFVVPAAFPEAGFGGVLGTFAAGLGIVVWWAFFSRAPRMERWGAVVLMVVAVFLTLRILHISLATAGMGMMFYFYAIPMTTFFLVVGVVASHRLSEGPRRAALVATILLATGGWALVRTGGISGSGGSEIAWRWSPTHEERLLAQAANVPAVLPASANAPAVQTPVSAEGRAAETPAPAEAAKTPEKQPDARLGSEAAAPRAAPAAVKVEAEWPGFRGPGRNGIAHSVRIETNWSATPPVEVWRHPIGPGWSSFAVLGDRFYTQEQRGDQEIVGCYNLKTGEPVWWHRDATRFWEANAGPGPRGTPTLSNGRVYTFGATGLVNALDARTGAVVWSRNAAADAEVKTPMWGFASSPLVVDDLVIVAVAGKLAAYDIATGAPRWFGPAGGVSYSSPQLVTLSGVKQVILLSKPGAISVAPADGKLLWEHTWPGFTMVQPTLTPEGDILISDEGLGMRRLAVSQTASGWTVTERWTSIRLKPYFNDYVIHNGYAFGFDGSILACIDLKDGERKWKGGRYGNGQLVLLPEQDLLVVLSEEGELVLVSATPDKFTELARVPAIEGKTWNHPALVGDLLLVRNGQEMAAFRLPSAGARSSR